MNVYDIENTGYYVEDVPLTNLEVENRMFCSQEGILSISQRTR